MENNSLPNYLNLFISNENIIHSNKQVIHSTHIDKHIKNNLDLVELQQYNESMNIGHSYYYCNIKPLAYTTDIYYYNDEYVNMDKYRL